MPHEIIDVHTHLGMSSTLQVGADVSDVLRIMDDNGISCAIPSPIPGYEDPRGIADSMEQNDNIARAIEEHPDRFPTGFGVVEPRHGAQALDEVNRIVDDLELSGLMFHNDFNGVPADHPSMFAILERLARWDGMVVLIHTAQHSILESPYQLGILAEAFPSLTFIDAHPFMDTVQLPASIDLARRHSNILFDTCLTHHHLWPIEKAVESIGANRLMFGSDIPYYDYCIERDIIIHSNIEDDQRQQIFIRTAERLFGLG